MSARQPFVPHRPDSNHPEPQTQNSNMNLNAGLKDLQQQQNPLNLGTDRPLNLAGFIKPKPSHKHQNKAQLSPSITGTPLKSRGSIEGVQRPMKPAALPKKQGSLKLRLSNSSTEK